MSKESFHIFNTNIAAELGTNEAIFINNMKFWIDHNVANGINFYDGRWWTFNSTSALQEVFFYWSVDQIDRIIKKLVKKGVVLVGNYNKKAADRTRWFAFVDQEKYLANPLKTNKPRNRGMETAKSRNGNREIAESYIDENINSDINLDIGRVFDQNASTPENSLENSLDENKNSNFGELKVNNAEKTTNSNNKDDCCIIYIMENNDLYSDSIEQNLSKSNTILNKKTVTKKSPPKPKKRESKRGSTLADDWELPEEWKQWALDASDGLPRWKEQFIRVQAQKFLNHHSGINGKPSGNWFKSWQTWCYNAGIYEKELLRDATQIKDLRKQKAKLAQEALENERIKEDHWDEWELKWELVLEELKKSEVFQAKNAYANWLDAHKFLGIENNCVKVGFWQQHYLQQVQNEYYHILKNICSRIMGVNDVMLVQRRLSSYNPHKPQFNDRGVSQLVY